MMYCFIFFPKYKALFCIFYSNEAVRLEKKDL